MFIEPVGMFLASEVKSRRCVEADDVERGMRADAIGAKSAAFLISLSLQTVGGVGVTELYRRCVCLAGGVIMLILRWLSKRLSTIDFVRRCGDALVVATSIGFGLISLVSPNSFFPRIGEERAEPHSCSTAHAVEFV